MKKIMFNDKYGLTQAVLEGRKTMTRRAVTRKLLECIRQYSHGDEEEFRCRLMANAPYKVGEVVAIAQSYDDVAKQKIDISDDLSYTIDIELEYGCRFIDIAGYRNKMFVKPELMPHHIRITGLKVEHLKDISNEDCLREGIYEHNPIPESPKMKGYAYDASPDIHKKRKWFGTPRDAFAALIDKVSGKFTWESNPLTYAYTFHLID